MEYKRKLTVEEKLWISELSVRSPRLAMNLAKTLKEDSYRIGGRTIFISRKDNEHTTENDKKLSHRKMKRSSSLKVPKMKEGKICGCGIFKDK